MKLKSLVLSALSAALLTPALAEDISMAAVPPIVQATIQQYQRGGKVDEIESRTAEGQTWYEATVELQNDRELQIHVRADGSLIKTSEEITSEEIPVTVRAAVIQSAPQGKIDEVHRVLVDGQALIYKVKVDRAEGDDLNLTIAENGAVLKLVED
ncbi:Putative beta-lactamase-inhibitor-like, PepSY-like [Prosthecobacter debontii]|uniref:Putative beta-lactamase-inhibitor-like, PepSY-like n=1 Tax=Prosthecobacter debontii TaxID=48467 RepID=A0A1T4XAP7_9BACT|nr:PepSY-like domain-containing protein [Prosthecobacter debontii]SKA86702.1 Putative beta-lactamase-inhibitor-like, PepSY-like [Prosthecobacter debontii]